jgi:hypothetical protein
MDVKPLPIKDLEAGAKAAAAVSLPGEDNATDNWLKEHPDSFDETKGSAEPTQPPTETPAEVPATEETPSEEKPVETPTDAPVTETTVEAKPGETVAEKPAEKPAAPKTFDASEKFALEDGNEWTRAQIIEGLQRAAKSEPIADGFQKLFGSDLETTTKNWGPILERLRNEPATVAFLNDFWDKPEKLAYLQHCSQHWDTEKGKEKPAAEPTIKLDAQTQKELDSLKAFKEKAEMAEVTARVQREMNDAIAKYPILANDEGLRKDLVMTAMHLPGGIPEAVAAKASIYDALTVARTKQAEAPKAPVVPALPTPSGAAPTTKTVAESKPKKFQDTADAVDDWIASNPDGYTG